ncbi:inorganic triphosphatase [mine drainage metagenome]|uniref:Inorganic triphosphatase n=1 Tax=mine drainage metagenome TaxID=410659 RepID=A0A1J5R5I4_9ZZZZ
MAEEIELKLSLPVAAQRLLLRQSVLKRAVSRHTQQLVNLYYDTHTLSLHKRGIALRLRKQGRTWLQTIKCAGSQAAGLSTRPEWETPYSGHFDFAAIDDPEVRRQLERPSLRKRLVPLFETSYRRTTWRFEPAPGCVFHLMADRGWVAAAGRRESISELELELESGDVNELFKLAQALAERLPLVPQILSKAERGYRLYRDVRAVPVKALPVPLAASCRPLACFRQIALSCLEHQQGNLEGVLNSEDPEFIHQMRVATRRLRAAMRLFAPRLPPDFIDQLLPPLRQLTARLGRARDLDVLLAEISMPVMQALPDEPRLAALVGAVTDRQYAARGAAVRYLQSAAYGRLMLLATALLQRPAFIEPAAEETIAVFASDRLKRLRKRVLELARAASTDDPGSLHRLRIAIKRLRYALEFFSPLCSGKALQRLLRSLGALQDELGQLNDLANAGVLLMHCAGDDPRLREAVSLVGGWHASRHRELLARIPGRLAELRRLSLPTLG